MTRAQLSDAWGQKGTDGPTMVAGLCRVVLHE